MDVMKVRGVILCLVAFTSLIIIGNPNPPPINYQICENELRLVASNSNSNTIVDLYYQNDKYICITSWDTWLQLNSTWRRLSDLLGPTFLKRIEIANKPGYTELNIIFYDSTGKTKLLEYCFILKADSSMIEFSINDVAFKSEGTIYSLTFGLWKAFNYITSHRIDEIVTSDGLRMRNDELSNYVFVINNVGYAQIPEIKYQIIKFENKIYFTLNLNSVEFVNNYFEWGVVSVIVTKKEEDGQYKTISINCSDSFS